MSVPRTGASGCGYWPSPTAVSRECNPEQWEERREDQGGTLRSTYLQDAVKYQVEKRSSYPTPKGSPSGPDFARASRPGSGGDDLATAIARGQSTPQTWGTPTSRDHKDTGTMENVPENALLGRQVLNRQKPWPTPRAANPGSRPNGKGGEILAEQARLSYATPRAEDSQCAGRRNNRETSDTLYAQTVTDTNSTPGSLSPLWVEWLQGFPPEWTDCAVSVTPSVLRRWLRRSRSWLAKLGYLSE